MSVAETYVCRAEGIKAKQDGPEMATMNTHGVLENSHYWKAPDEWRGVRTESKAAHLEEDHAHELTQAICDAIRYVP